MKNERSAAADMHDQYLADQELAEQVKRAFTSRRVVKEVKPSFNGCDCSLGLAECNCTAACQLPEPAFAADPKASAAVAVALVLACVVLAFLLSAEAPRLLQWMAA